MSNDKKVIFEVYDLPLEQVNTSQNNGLETPSLTGSNVIILNLSDRQFIEFLSALEQGAELLYPDKMHEMTDIFLQGVQ